MRFTKCHGAGNDFVVLDARLLDRPWGELAKHMCDRHFGVGSDGLILILASQSAALAMRMFNPDGSEAEACGNGLRCFVKYAVDHKLVSSSEFAVETLGGIRRVKAFLNAAGKVSEAEVGMGAPRFEPHEIPARVIGRTAPVLNLELEVLDHQMPVNLVSMGNPHAVTFLTHGVSEYPLTHLGPVIEHHSIFPSRVNFEVAHVEGRHDIEARVWERGAGETLACGTGACAIAVASQLLGHCDPRIRVHLPGGVLTVTWNGAQDEVFLRGPVEQVFEGEWPD